MSDGNESSLAAVNRCDGSCFFLFFNSNYRGSIIIEKHQQEWFKDVFLPSDIGLKLMNDC